MLARLRGSLTALLVGWVATRVLLVGALTGLIPYPDGPSILNDVKLYSEWSSLLVTGRFPIGDDMWQYPPGAGVVFAIAALLGSNPVAAFTPIGWSLTRSTVMSRNASAPMVSDIGSIFEGTARAMVVVVYII